MNISRWIGAAVVAVTAVAASAEASAQVGAQAWQGTMYLTGAVNQAARNACANGGWSGNEHLTSVFRPRLSNNEPPAAISILNPRYAALISVRGGNGRFGRRGQVDFREFRSRASFFEARNMRYANFQTRPANIRRNTLGVTVTGRFNNFGGIQGCHVTFQAGYVKRP